MVSEMGGENAPFRMEKTFPWGYGGSENNFPFRKNNVGGKKEWSERSMALLACFREYACNFHTFRTYYNRAEDIIYLTTIEIDGQIYALGAHNGRCFSNRRSLEKALVANESEQIGVSLQGKGLKLPQCYLTDDNHQELIVCSHNQASGEFYAGSSIYNEANVIIESNSELDDVWRKKLMSRFGDKFKDFNVFYLIKISPLFKPEHCSIGVLWQNFADLMGHLSEDLTIIIGESLLDESQVLDEQFGQPSHAFVTYSHQEMLRAYCCKDDNGKSSVEDSICESSPRKINCNIGNYDSDIMTKVRISVMSGKKCDSLLKELRAGNSDANQKLGTLRSWRGLGKAKVVGEGARCGVVPKYNAFLKLTAPCKIESGNFERFKSQPIALIQTDESNFLFRALNLPYYGKYKPNLKVESGPLAGQMVVGRTPFLKIDVIIEEVKNLRDTSSGENKNNPLYLLGALRMRGDFLMSFDARFREIRDEIMMKACEAAADEIAKKYPWLKTWCEERFEEEQFGLYEPEMPICEIGAPAKQRKIKKWDLHNWAHGYKLQLASDRMSYVALQDEETKRFINNELDSTSISRGCRADRIDNFVDFIEEHTAAKISESIHWPISSEERDKVVLSITAEKDALIKTYKSLCENHNKGEQIIIYRIVIGSVGYVDEDGRTARFTEEFILSEGGR